MSDAPIASRLAAAALVSWSAVVAGAPGVTGAPGFGAAIRTRATPADARRILEADLRTEAYRLWQASGFGSDRYERAAWVVASSGGVAWRPWPWDRRDLQARWLGPAPPGAFAIVHTHPAIVDPRPSPQDEATAAQVGFAVYTVSRSGIWRVEPGGAVTRVGDETWWAGCGSGQACREGVSGARAIANARNPAGGETAADHLRITE